MRGDDEDYTMATKQRLVDRLRVILAGRAAEEVSHLFEVCRITLLLTPPPVRCTVNTIAWISAALEVKQWQSFCC